MNAIQFSIPLSSALDNFRSVLPSLTREEALIIRRRMERYESSDAEVAYKQVRCPVEDVTICAGGISFSLAFAFVTGASFFPHLLRVCSQAARQALDGSLFARLSERSTTTKDRAACVFSADKRPASKWMIGFAEDASVGEIIAAKAAITAHFSVKSNQAPVDLCKWSRASFEISGASMVLTLTPKDSGRAAFFAALVSLLSAKQLIALDSRLTLALASAVEAGKKLVLPEKHTSHRIGGETGDPTLAGFETPESDGSVSTSIVA